MAVYRRPECPFGIARVKMPPLAQNCSSCPSTCLDKLFDERVLINTFLKKKVAGRQGGEGRQKEGRKESKGKGKGAGRLWEGGPRTNLQRRDRGAPAPAPALAAITSVPSPPPPHLPGSHEQHTDDQGRAEGIMLPPPFGEVRPATSRLRPQCT